MKETRRRLIEEFVERRQAATMTELCEEFQVSINTIRADVAYLVESGALEKVYGGVRSRQKQVALFDIRAGLHGAQKHAIAKRAAELVEPGDVIYIDNGTTTMYLPEYLADKPNVTIITANLYVISNIYNKPNLDLIVLPGMLDRRTYSLTDASTNGELRKYQPAKGFIATTGIMPDGALSVSTYQEYENKKTALAQCRRAYLLADSSKFDESNLMSYGNLDQMEALITDPMIPPEYRDFCLQHHVPLQLAGEAD